MIVYGRGLNLNSLTIAEFMTFIKVKMLRRDFHVLDMYLCRLIKKYDIILEYLLFSSKYLDLSLLSEFFRGHALTLTS